MRRSPTHIARLQNAIRNSGIPKRKPFRSRAMEALKIAIVDSIWNRERQGIVRAYAAARPLLNNHSFTSPAA